MATKKSTDTAATPFSTSGGKPVGPSASGARPDGFLESPTTGSGPAGLGKNFLQDPKGSNPSGQSGGFEPTAQSRAQTPGTADDTHDDETPREMGGRILQANPGAASARTAGTGSIGTAAGSRPPFKGMK